MRIALVTDNRWRILQAKTMYDSLDTEYIVAHLRSEYEVDLLTHHQLQTANLNIYDCIIYSTSQVHWYKQYVELNFQFIDQHVKLIPSLPSLLSHENKAWEYMWLKQNFKDALDFKFYADIHSFVQDDWKYPIVVKKADGSSSRGVKICHSERQALHFIKKIKRWQLISELAQTPIIQYFHHIRETRDNANFLVQECICDYDGDYRIHVMGDKFFGYFRELKPQKEYTSGNGSINHYDIDLDFKLLDLAQQLQSKINSPHIIFDFVLDGDQIKILEFSAIHPGNTALYNSNYYYQQEEGTWVKKAIDENYILEDFYLDAYRYAITAIPN